jgi:hypothetical protein
MNMATPFDLTEPIPQIPKWQCNACQEVLQLPRRWAHTKSHGYQILIDWDQAEQDINNHEAAHGADLIKGIEDWLHASS